MPLPHQKTLLAIFVSDGRLFYEQHLYKAVVGGNGGHVEILAMLFTISINIAYSKSAGLGLDMYYELVTV